MDTPAQGPPTSDGAVGRWRVLQRLVYIWEVTSTAYLQLRTPTKSGLAPHGLWGPLPAALPGHLCLRSQGSPPGRFNRIPALEIN